MVWTNSTIRRRPKKLSEYALVRTIRSATVVYNMSTTYLTSMVHRDTFHNGEHHSSLATGNVLEGSMKKA